MHHELCLFKALNILLVVQGFFQEQVNLVAPAYVSSEGPGVAEAEKLRYRPGPCSSPQPARCMGRLGMGIWRGPHHSLALKGQVPLEIWFVSQQLN